MCIAQTVLRSSVQPNAQTQNSRKLEAASTIKTILFRSDFTFQILVHVYFLCVGSHMYEFSPLWVVKMQWKVKGKTVEGSGPGCGQAVEAQRKAVRGRGRGVERQWMCQGRQ